MITIILAILFGTFKTINTQGFICRGGSNCQCSFTSLDDIKIDYIDNSGMQIIVDVSSWNGLEVICSGTKRLADFKYSSNQPGKSINSLTIRSCVLSKITSLKKFVKKLGIEKPITLSFQYIKTNTYFLTREHFKGISDVKELVLSYNGLSVMSIEFFADFPNLEKLDLSHNNIAYLNDIFNATPSLKYLDLSHNFINSISSTLFYKLEYLEYLDLGYNSIGNINGSTFDKLVLLKSLNLRSIKVDDLSWNLFSKLKKLEIIDMSYCTFVRIPEKLFNENKNLRHIFFHNMIIDSYTLPEYLFSNLRKLEDIYLNHDGFLTLPNNLFRNSSSLKHIHIENNFIYTFHETLFQGLRNLEVLKINNNLVKVMHKGMFIDLKKLKILNFSNNKLGFIPSGVFEGLTSLTELNMENNRLSYIEAEAFVPLKKLRIAKFFNNRLNFSNKTDDWSLFYNNHLLEELHLSNNSIKTFFKDWSMGKKLKFLNLSHNSINTLSTKTFYFPSNKTLVDLRFNNISNIFLNGTEVPAINQTEKRYVRILIDDNPILCDCHLYDLIRYFNKKLPKVVYNYIELVSQNLTCIYTNGIKGPIIEQLTTSSYICPVDDYLEINTNCPIECKCRLRLKDKTRILDCSNNNLFDFITEEEEVFSANDYPVILNLTGNFLEKIPSVEPFKSTKLSGLLLSNNRISEVTINELPLRLKVLELHNNNISRIDSNVIKYFNYSFLTDLTLSGNPIICDCDVLDLFLFVKLNRDVYKDLNKLTCEHQVVPMYDTNFKSFCAPVIGIRE
ncbi:hypothetical protein M0802_006400 [Mischocyttarus mexicanus]|nr:hypothetical protein M0802_006400 [Mischocyttarus mexicanus]